MTVRTLRDHLQVLANNVMTAAFEGVTRLKTFG